jgi:hypothetical protein
MVIQGYVSVVQESLPEIIEVVYLMYYEVCGSNTECMECLAAHGSRGPINIEEADYLSNDAAHGSRGPINIEEGDYLSNVHIGGSLKE